MRVTRFARHANDERGAVLVIVVLSLIATLGMVAMSVDGGGMVLERRAMVNANDAAALAFAQQCALGNLESDARAAATTLAGQNVANSQIDHVTIISGSCDGLGSSGTVEVEYFHDRKMYFAPVVGFPNTVNVAAQATATWGALSSSSNVTPLELDSSQLRDICNFHPEADPPTPPVGTRCTFWYNNDAASSQYGVLNLDLWHVAADAQCSSAGANDRSNWITSGYPGSLSLLPQPTYVCLDTGANESNWHTLTDEIGNEKLFPVNDSTGFSGYPQVDRSGAGCTDAAALAGSCTPDKYSIVGFAILLLTGLYDGNNPTAIGTGPVNGTCPSSGQGYAQTFTPTVTTKDITEFLCSTNSLNYPGAAIDPWPRLKAGSGTTTFTYAPGATCPAAPNNAGKYLYDGATHVVTWCGTLTGTQTQNVRIDWEYTDPAQPGLCGVHPSDPNAKCLVTEYRGFTTDSGNPCTLPPQECPRSNVYAVTLTK